MYLSAKVALTNTGGSGSLFGDVDFGDALLAAVGVVVVVAVDHEDCVGVLFDGSGFA